MSAMSDFLEGEIIKHWFRTGSASKPTALTVHLYTAAPGETGGGTEVSGGSYAAQNLNPLDANWAAPASGDGHTENSVAITYPTPTAAWGAISHMAIKDQVPNYLVYGALASPKTVNNGDPAPSFAIGALDVTFA